MCVPVVLCVSLVIVFMVAGLCFGEETGEHSVRYEGPTSFAGVYDGLDPSKNTELFIREYWKEINGLEIDWSGSVVDVKGSRGKSRVYIRNEARPASGDYNIIVTIYDVSAAAKLKKGDNVNFRGFLAKYKRNGKGILFYIDNGEFR